MYPGGLCEHRYPHFKNSQEFAFNLGGGVIFNILAINGDWNVGLALIFCINVFIMSLALELNMVFG